MILPLTNHRDDTLELKKQLLLLGRQLLAEGRLVEAWKMLLTNRGIALPTRTL